MDIPSCFLTDMMLIWITLDKIVGQHKWTNFLVLITTWSMKLWNERLPSPQNVRNSISCARNCQTCSSDTKIYWVLCMSHLFWCIPYHVSLFGCRRLCHGWFWFWSYPCRKWSSWKRVSWSICEWIALQSVQACTCSSLNSKWEWST